METATLLIRCPDTKGIVAKISSFLFRHDVNIIQSDQHSFGTESPTFFMRVEFLFDPEKVSREAIGSDFGVIASQINAKWQIHYASTVMNMGILVSRQDHCLFDLIYRWRSGELRVNIPFVISNHPDVGGLVEQFGIPFHHVPVGDDKREQEKEILRIAKDTSDFLVLARYMQILSPFLLSEYKKDIINIHHSFLPSFKGANPYRQAYNRGVKVIGATAHFVTADLDEGPIIEQVVERVSHRDDEKMMKKKGKNLEKLALANAIGLYSEHRIIRFQNKTIVFS
ncbi:MAG: formyltetrahydrofolate deformylase [Chitinispirillaceae bacterium]